MRGARANRTAVPTGTALAFAANNFDQETPPEARGFFLFFRITTRPGVETCAVKMQVKDPLSGVFNDYIVLAAATFAAAAPANFVFRVAPDAHADTDATVIGFTAPIPTEWRLVITPSATNGWVLGCSVQYF